MYASSQRMGRTPFYTAVTCRRYTIVEIMLRMTGIKFNKKDVSLFRCHWWRLMWLLARKQGRAANGASHTSCCVCPTCGEFQNLPRRRMISWSFPSQCMIFFAEIFPEVHALSIRCWVQGRWGALLLSRVVLRCCDACFTLFFNQMVRLLETNKEILDFHKLGRWSRGNSNTPPCSCQPHNTLVLFQRTLLTCFSISVYVWNRMYFILKLNFMSKY